MEDNQQQAAKGKGSLFNPFKRVLRNLLGFPVHYRGVRTPTYEQLKSLLNFEQIANLNEREVVEIEGKWEGVKGSVGKDSLKYHETKNNNVNYIMEKIIELYCKKGEINESIGPFTDFEALMKEAGYAANGTPPKPEDITFNIAGTTINSNFHVPDEVPIKYNDGREYKVAFFGVRADNPYWTQLGKDIDKIAEDIKNGLASQAQQNDNINQYIDFLSDEIKGWVGAFKEYISPVFEEKHRSNLQGGAGVEQHWKVIETYRGDLMKLALQHEEVYYTHTYKVIKKLDGSGNLYDKNGHMLGTLPSARFPEGKEQGPGLDENGWPLEVGDGNTIFGGRVIPLGTVVIDFYEGHSPNGGIPREVPQIFIEDCDLLDTAIWVYSMYDAYRDTLRDARYHNKSITVMEQIMTELDIPDLEHPQTLKDIEEGRHAEITMKLNHPPPNSVKMTIEASHLNPAFDLRTYIPTTGGKTLDRDRMMYPGRKYYYEGQDQSVKSDHPTITTRGAALYILHRVIEETKHWSSAEDPTRPGVMELLDLIGGEINGFDIGPNMNLNRESPGWGRRFSNNPFRPRIY